MKNEILNATFWTVFWLLLFAGLFILLCGAANAQVTVHTQGNQYRHTNGVSGFNRTTTITARQQPIPASPLLYINPYVVQAEQREAKAEARKCAVIILDNIPAAVYKRRLLRRFDALSEEDQTALRKRILAAEGNLDVALFERLLDEAAITNALSKESL
jgi:hypothetical protein